MNILYCIDTRWTAYRLSILLEEITSKYSIRSKLIKLIASKRVSGVNIHRYLISSTSIPSTSPSPTVLKVLISEMSVKCCVITSIIDNTNFRDFIAVDNRLSTSNKLFVKVPTFYNLQSSDIILQTVIDKLNYLLEINIIKKSDLTFSKKSNNRGFIITVHSLGASKEALDAPKEALDASEKLLWIHLYLHNTYWPIKNKYGENYIFECIPLRFYRRVTASYSPPVRPK